MTGQTLGHYQILEKLGSGGMGDVYQARDTHLNRMVAIKVLRAERVVDEGRKRRFIQEAQAASALNHPNIVIVHDITNQNGLDYMVMECVAGKTLDALIPRQGMRLGDALKVSVQMADALIKAHGAGIIHRDLKPSNVMVSDDGHVKLLDFGLAKLTEIAPAGEDERTRTQLPETEEGTILGTTAYMSPEQAEGRKLDVRSDIFSFGSVLYEMVTGQRAFVGESRLSTLSAILKEEPKPPEAVPADLEKIIRRCLRKDPARRFQHMDDLKVALEEVREDSESGRLTAAGAATPQKGVPNWIWAAGLVLALAALGAWWVSRPVGKPVEALREMPLTSYPGSEINPTFSPDGRQVAFAWNGEKRDTYHVYVKMVDGGDPLQVTRGAADDLAPQWSPDGRFIAFVRSGAIYLISPLGGAERKVTDAGTGQVAWTPDGKSIAFNEGPRAQAGPVMLLNLETGDRRGLTHPPASSAGDRSFSFSPDGKSLAFARLVFTSGTGELYVMALPDGAPKHLELTANFLDDVAWSPDGKDVLAIVERGGTTTLWRVPVESGQPSRVGGVDLGVGSLAVSGASHRLAYSRTVSDENIWTFDGAAKTQLIASTRRDFDPQFSPEGSKIAFVSDRTGGWEIYVSDAQGGHVVQLTSFGNAVADGVRWSPDGREIAFAVVPQGGNRDIYVAPADGGTVRRMNNEPSDEGRPSFSMDGKWIYFRSNRSGKEEIWKMPRAGGAATQVTQAGGFEALETLDGKTLYFIHARTEKGLWSMPVAGGTAQAVAGLESVSQGAWGVAQNGVCYVEMGQAGAAKAKPILCWNSSTRKTSQVAVVDKPVWSIPPSFSVSRDGLRFLWNQTDHRDSDLVLVENFR
jgi:Tol biopolymer transport system component